MSFNVDPVTRRRVGDAPILREAHFAVLSSVRARSFPHASDAVEYHTDLACVYAAFLCGAMDGAMRARPKRKANVDGYQGDLALGAYGQTVAYLSGATGNTDLISGDAGQHVLLVLSTRYPPLAEPLRKHIATKGSDAMAVGATTARVALATVERNGFRSKVEPLELTMMIPGLHRLAREGVEAHIGVEFDKLVRPLTVG